MARAKGFNKESVYEFYDKVEMLIEKHKLNAEHMHNMDESGITTVQRPGRVIGKRGKKQIGSLTSGERGFITTEVCSMSAAGRFAPPMIFFKRQRMVSSFKQGAPPGSIVENNDTGWMNKELFLVWLKHFVSNAGCTESKPVLLILDGGH